MDKKKRKYGRTQFRYVMETLVNNDKAFQKHLFNLSMKEFRGGQRRRLEIFDTAGRDFLFKYSVVHFVRDHKVGNVQIHRQALRDDPGIFIIFRFHHNCFDQRRWKLYLSYVVNTSVLLEYCLEKFPKI